MVIPSSLTYAVAPDVNGYVARWGSGVMFSVCSLVDFGSVLSATALQDYERIEGGAAAIATDVSASSNRRLPTAIASAASVKVA